jgi:sugar O-acyltransferase (sialic acid O-acetyltransferase NeuD family)
MTLPIFAVYGVSGCGRGVMPLAREQLRMQGVRDDRLVFIDDNPNESNVNGHQVLTYPEFIEIKASERYVAIAIANSSLREKLASRCSKDGVLPWSISATNIVIMDNVKIGEGSILSPFVTLTSNIQIGQYFQANLYSYVEHDCVIGDFVTFAPAVKCNGNIIIKDHVYIGAGAVIKQGAPGNPMVIGVGAVIGMGAVVTKSVAPGDKIAGNPAKKLS